MFTLQHLPACDPEGTNGDTVGKVTDFSLHTGVAARFEGHRKLGRLCRCILWLAVGPAVWEYFCMRWS